MAMAHVMSALGHKRTFCSAIAMSALDPPKADIHGREWHVRYRPEGGHLNDFVDTGDSLTSAREHRRLMQKRVVVDLLDDEIRHVGARYETACPVTQID